MPVPVVIVRCQVRINHVLVPALGNVLLVALEPADFGMINAPDALAFQHQRRLVTLRLARVVAAHQETKAHHLPLG